MEIGIISEQKLLHYLIFRRISGSLCLRSKVSCLLYTIGNLCSCFSRLQCVEPIHVSFLSTMSLSCLLTGKRKDSPVWKFYVLYMINNLVNQWARWPCRIRTTVMFVGECLPGKFQQVDNASAGDSQRRLRLI